MTPCTRQDCGTAIEDRAIRAMRGGDHKAMERILRPFRRKREAEWSELERLYGPKRESSR